MEPMELRHLRTIVAVAQHRSLTKAGEELYLSQSAVSQQIRRLEEELGIEVFRRTSRSVELTAQGRVILGYASACWPRWTTYTPSWRRSPGCSAAS
jgi:DNA-binding transcriptional LysR family regulator